MFITDAVKAIDGSLELDVLGMPHGTDREGQSFDAQTDLGGANEIPVVVYHGYDELGAAKVDYIGTAVKSKRDAAGQWFRVSLDAAKAKAQRIYADATKGLVRASSDAIAHLVRPYGIVGKPGRVSSWPIAALSLMDAETSKRAINPGAIAIPAMKAYLIELENRSGEAAAKAGATFASRNRDRIMQIKQALDDMIAEFNKEEAGEPAVTPLAKAPAVKGFEMETENKGTAMPLAGDATLDWMKDWGRSMAAILEKDKIETRQYLASELGKHETAVKAELDKKLETAVSATQRPTFANVTTTASVRDNSPAAKAQKIEDESRAFDYWLRYGQVEPSFAAAKAALNETTAGQGGYLVPTKYSNELVTIKYLPSVLRDMGARVIPVDGTNSFKWPALTNTTAAILTSEAAAYDEVEPTFTEITFVPYKYTRVAKASLEAVNDSRVPVGDIVLQDANYAFVQAENPAFTTGTGASQPQGVSIGATLGKTTAAVAAVTADEIIDFYHSLSYQYRSSPTTGFIFSDGVIQAIRKLKDTANNYLWANAYGVGGLTQSLPPTLMGKPVFTDNSLPAMATGAKFGVFGDVSYFYIADFGQQQAQRLNELYAANGQVGWLFSKRFDSHVMLGAAINYIKNA